ncbi:MAG: D-alanyl-D-alanine carboxypeptidase family protein [Pseudomonadota bacterium]
MFFSHRFIFIVLLGLLNLTQNAFTAPKVIPKAPIIAANSYIMIDYDSGKVLAEKNSNVRVSPASITKVMTAYVVFSELKAGNIKLDDLVTISKKAWQTQGSRMFIEVNRKVSVEKLLQGMIIQSGNDASVALAEYVAGSEDSFAALMNQHAGSLGMSKTQFLNSTGLPDAEHLTTAKDLAILASALIRKFPEYYKWYSTKEFTYNKIKQFNRNRLLWRDKSVDGMKTGYTKDAGYCLLASSKRENMRIITVVLGTKSKSARAQESQKLLNFGFRFFETHALYKANVALKHIKAYKGNLPELGLGLKETLFVTIPRGQYKNLKPMINVKDKIIAPVLKGQPLGEVEIKLNDKVIAKKSVVALHDLAEGSLWQRGRDSIILMFK